MPCDSYHKYIRKIYQLQMLLCDSISLAEDEHSQQKQQKLLDGFITLGLIAFFLTLKSWNLGAFSWLLTILRAQCMAMTILLINMLMIAKNAWQPYYVNFGQWISIRNSWSTDSSTGAVRSTLSSPIPGKQPTYPDAPQLKSGKRSIQYIWSINTLIAVRLLTSSCVGWA